MTLADRRFTVSFFIWLLTGTAAVVAGLNWMPASSVDGSFVPVGPDAFYHARRILDAAIGDTGFYQFDLRIHMPEGSMLTWPWAYDWLCARIVAAFQGLSPARDPMQVLVLIPVYTTLLTAALWLALVRALGASHFAAILGGACFALSPLTQALHAVGRIDHHFVEFAFVLGFLITAITWMQNQTSRAAALATGILLGVAPAFHNGLFVLQAPLIAGLVILAFRKLPVPSTTSRHFAIALLAATVMVLIPSQPFRAGSYAFYLLSWFHLAAASFTALTVLLATRALPSRHALWLLSIAALLLLNIAQVRQGFDFVGANVAHLASINEVRSPLKSVFSGGLSALLTAYSGFFLVLPVTFACCLYGVVRGRDPARVVFDVGACGGLALLLAQERLHYFGSFALYLPLIITADHLRLQLAPARRITVSVLSIAALALAMWPGLYHLSDSPALGGHLEYLLQRPMFLELGKRCEREPGVVLADFNDGHYLRFHTDCSIIANNFIMTEQHLAKIDLVETMLALTPSELKRDYPWVRYVYVRRADNILAASSHEERLQRNKGLRGALLFGSDGGHAEGFEQFAEARVGAYKGQSTVFARAFAVE
ncbi:MAG: hypothetical protein O7H40_06525 [Gammaproteobacteria bacterium]|nr:hypothetical protein [Gammaproteobacteria bacterium]